MELIPTIPMNAACFRSRSFQPRQRVNPDAMKIVLQHYAGYIAYLSTRKVRDKYGNVYYGIDEGLVRATRRPPPTHRNR